MLMKLPTFSIRTILGLIVGMMGMLAIVLSLISGSIHQELIFDNQRIMMEEMIRVEVNQRLNDLKDISRDLGLSMQSTVAFKKALKRGDRSDLVMLLNNQFHQYFVTADVIKLKQLILLDQDFKMLAESTEGKVLYQQGQKMLCPKFFKAAEHRTGSQRMKIMHDLCMYDGEPVYAVIMPVGGLRLKGYIVVVTSPIHNLLVIESDLGIPISLQLKNKGTVFKSAKWPADEKDSLISSYALASKYEIPILSILTSQNLTKLTKLLRHTRLEVLLISGIITCFIVVFVYFLMRKTMLNPLKRLTSKLRNLHEDQSTMGDQLKVTGSIEMHEIIGGFNDMSNKLSGLYKSLESMAYTDTLTRLPNRNQFQESMENCIRINKQLEEKFTLFLIDLDRFKGVNDTLGHHVGDELLKAVSLRMHNTLRDSDFVNQLDEVVFSDINKDMVARLGGDEFSIILPNVTTIEDSVIVARKLIRAMESPFKINEHQLLIGLSIGVAMYPDHGIDLKTLVSHADAAMYEAKTQKCGFSIYDSEQNKGNLDNLKLEQDLFSSIKRNELKLYYQPKISLVDEHVVSSEVLIRWNHPEYGLIFPNDFIPMAEQSGLIQPLTEWILNKVLEDCSIAQKNNMSLNVAVNLSALNLRDERLPLKISDALKKWSVPAEMLTLELTESAIMADPVFAISILNKLDAMGVSLSIDDFGTGYSSLSYVKNLPVDEIKIDQSFIFDLIDDADNEAIVCAVLVLAQHMNLTVVAEGVEDVETLNRLRKLGCDIAQGYYFARPMPYEKYIKWLETSDYALPDLITVND